MSARAHDCDACGGSGVSVDAVPPSDGLCCPAGAECICCPACFGAGRISDVRTARDAMVDAETLELNRGLAEHTNDGDEFSCALFMARQKGRAAHMAMIYMPPAAWWPGESEKDAFFCAYDAARAAFRAVPALREEE